MDSKTGSVASIGTETTGSGTAETASVSSGKNPVSTTGSQEIIQEEIWGNKTEFMLTLIGYAIGFGNIWRFPYLVQKNGGAAFLIPYIICLFLAGIPVFFIELAVGQRMRRGSVGSWNAVSPYFIGVGISAGLVCVVVETYYNTLLAWCVSYFVWSFTFPKLLWAECPKLPKINETVLRYDNFNITDPEHSLTLRARETRVERPEVIQECELAGSAKYFWYRQNLGVSTGIEDFGEWNWWMTLFIVIAWIMIYLCVVKGTKVSGKIVYFTTLFPFLVLFIFFIIGFTLKDYGEGFKILYAPKKLLEGKVWLDAGSQIFFSLGLGFGCLITFSSYLPFNNDCYFDSFFVPIVNCFTSLFCSIVMFMILGSKGMLEYRDCLSAQNQTVYDLIDVKASIAEHTAKNWTLKELNFPHDNFIHLITATLVNNVTNEEYIHPIWGFENNTDNLIYIKYCNKEDIVRNTGSGTGLVFITFAQAVLQLPGSQAWAIIFFLMMITLGIDSSFGTLEGVISAIWDLKVFPYKKWVLITIICIIYTIVATVLFSPGFGMYVLTFIDELCTGWPLMVIALGECFAIAWVYGLKQFSYDVKLMTGRRPTFYLLFCWRFVTPITLVIILFASLVLQFKDGVKYPVWRKDLGRTENVYWPNLYIGIGPLISILVVSAIPINAVLVKFGIKILKEPRAVLPEEQLKQERNYDEVKDAKSTSSLQRIMMSKSMEDLKDEFKTARQSFTSLHRDSDPNKDTDKTSEDQDT